MKNDNPFNLKQLTASPTFAATTGCGRGFDLDLAAMNAAVALLPEEDRSVSFQ